MLGRISKGLARLLESEERMPAFASAAAAEKYFFERRDEYLRRMAELASKQTDFSPDFSLESLKKLEKWYFALIESNGFDGLGIERREFEIGMAMYYGEVAVRNSEKVKWIVQEGSIEKGKYQIALEKGPLHKVILESMGHIARIQGNKSRTAIYRKCKQLIS